MLAAVAADQRDHQRGGGRSPSGLSVVIPARNAAGSLGAQLEALAGQDLGAGQRPLTGHDLIGPWEVVVADNGSTDDTRAVAQRYADRLPHLVVVDAAAVRTSAYARNAGAAAARYDRLLFCDADDVVGERWLAAHARQLAATPLSTGPVVLDRLNPPAAVAARDGGWPTAPPVGNDFLPFAMTCNLGVRRIVFEALGGLDERRNNGNDKVFCWSAQLAGSDLGFSPQAVVHYRLRTTSRGVWHRQLAIGRAAPSLYARFAAAGMPPSPPRAALRDWLWLAATLPRLGDAAHRHLWMRVAGRRVGRLEGSLRTRTWYP